MHINNSPMLVVSFVEGFALEDFSPWLAAKIYVDPLISEVCPL